MLEKLDLYGKAIKLNFKGEDTYKTKVGGLMSLLLVTSMIGYAISRFSTMIEKSEQKNSFNEIYHNLTDIGELTGEKMSYQVGFGFFDKKTIAPMSHILDETYFKINMMESGFTIDNSRVLFSLGSVISTIDCADWPLADKAELASIL